MSRDTIWLLSAYHADSHAWWSNWLINKLPFNWHLFSLPGRHFRWRIRGNPLAWMDLLPSTPPAAIVATSMVDLATLRGIRPDLGAVPTLLYFHENQFAYPLSAGQHRSIDPQMVQLYAALSANRLAFNSAWNRDSFFEGITSLGRRLPDHCPEDLALRLAPKSEILPVPLRPIAPQAKDDQLILWNHRWEYDKSPELFADAITLLRQRNIPFRLALLGPRPGPTPNALSRLREIAGSRILVDAEVTREDYNHWLARARLVVSTATHEFQGLAVMEAVSAGAAPLVPDALCYVEQYPTINRYPAGDAAALAEHLTAFLQRPPLVPDISTFLEENLSSHWTAGIQQLLHSST